MIICTHYIIPTVGSSSDEQEQEQQTNGTQEEDTIAVLEENKQLLHNEGIYDWFLVY